MRRARTGIVLLILLVALGVAVFMQRDWIRDALFDMQQPTMPEAVAFRDVPDQSEKSSKLPADDHGGDSSIVEDQNDAIQDDARTTDEEGVGTEPEPESEPESAATEKVGVQELPEEGTSEPSSSTGESADRLRADAPESIPSEFNLAVPFTSQAPHADWSLPYKEACEEASIYMVHAFYEGLPGEQIDSGVADESLLALVDLEKDLFGYYQDTTVAETAQLTAKAYGYETEVLDNPTAREIKAHVAAGRPVVVPAAGRELGNPYFTAPGPVYHMYVIRGYTEDSFIVNDPGTRRGEAFIYSIDTVMNALHDWNQGDEITDGGQRALVIYPN